MDFIILTFRLFKMYSGFNFDIYSPVLYMIYSNFSFKSPSMLMALFYFQITLDVNGSKSEGQP